jgi:hypothetical protein
MQRRSYKLIETLKLYDIDPKWGAEVGVQFGKNACNLLNVFPDLNLWLVDNYDITKTIHQNHTTEEVVKIALDKLDKYKGRFQWLLYPSVEAAYLVDDKTLDYAFIDAEHTYEAVKEDIKAWLPKIKMGGLLFGHDFSARFRGVKRAAKEAFGNRLEHWGDLWWIHV